MDHSPQTMWVHGVVGYEVPPQPQQIPFGTRESRGQLLWYFGGLVALWSKIERFKDVSRHFVLEIK